MYPQCTLQQHHIHLNWILQHTAKSRVSVPEIKSNQRANKSEPSSLQKGPLIQKGNINYSKLITMSFPVTHHNFSKNKCVDFAQKYKKTNR